MDKEEFRIKLDQINHLVEVKDYKGAMEVVDSIDWRRVKNVRTLCVVGEIYAANKRYEDSKEIFLLAYHRASIGKNILYRLVEVSLKMGEIDEAMDYYEEFCSVAPNDNTAYVLRYKILKARNAPLEDQIQVLEEYKSREFTEKWSYELAKLYYRAGEKEKCSDLCSEIILWFSEGPYVMKAYEMKTKMGTLTDREKDNYEKIIEETEQKKSSARKTEEPEEQEPVIEEIEIKKEKKKPGKVKEEVFEEEESEEIVEEVVISEETVSDVVEIHPDDEDEIIEEEVIESEDETEDESEEEYEDDSEEEYEDDSEEEYEDDSEEEYEDDSEEEYEDDSEDEYEDDSDEEYEDDSDEEYEEEYEDDSENDYDEEYEEEPDDESDEVEADEEQSEEDEYPYDESEGDEEDYEEEEEEEEYEEDEYEDDYEDSEVSSFDDDDSVIDSIEVDDSEDHDSNNSLQERIVRGLKDLFGGRKKKEEYDSEDSELDEDDDAEYEDEYEEDDSEYEEESEENDSEYEDEYEEDDSEYEEEYEEDDSEYEEEYEDDDSEYEDDDDESSEEEYEDDYEYSDNNDDSEIEEESEEEEEKKGSKKREFKLPAFRIPKTIKRKTSTEEKEEVEEPEKKPAAAKEIIDNNMPQDISNEIFEEPEETKTEDFNLEDTILAAAFAQGIEIPGAGPKKTEEKVSEEDNGEMIIPEEDILEELPEGNEEASKKVPDLIMPNLDNLLEEEEFDSEVIIIEEEEEQTDLKNNDDFVAEIIEGENEEDEDEEEFLVTGFIDIDDEDEEELIDMDEDTDDEDDDYSIEDFISSIQPEESNSDAVPVITRSKELSEEEKKLFSYFVKVPGMKEQIIDTLYDVQIEASKKNSTSGNVIVMGGPESGKTRLISGLIPAICRELDLKASKVAYVFADQINGKDIDKIISKLAGGFLVIEQANQLDQETAAKLNSAMEGDTKGMIFILEDDKIGMRKMMARYPKFARKFTSTINIPVFTNDELAYFAKVYAMENGYRIDNNGMLTLYNMISINQKEDVPMNIGAVKEFVDAAIQKSQGKLGLKKKNKKRMDDDGFVVLYEKDFVKGK